MLVKFAQDRNGATLAYVALALTAMLGVIGLSYDLGRTYILSTELQKAADAAASAGAYQLDGQATDSVVAARVADAVSGSAVTANINRVGKPGTVGAITIASHRILDTIPDDDDDPITNSDVGPPYNYVEVTTAAKSNNNVFAQIFGHPAETSMTRTAVARKGQAICNTTPMMACLPNDPNFDPDNYIGHQVLLRNGPGGGAGSWGPGNWGFLIGASGDRGAAVLRQTLARQNGLNECIDTAGTVDTEPGAKEGAVNAINVRFDMYENPGFGNQKGNALYPPAEQVGKGQIGTGNGAGGQCKDYEYVDADPANRTHYPRDSDIGDANRYGNGNWDCDQYWANTYEAAGSLLPSPCSEPGITRYETYLYEIANKDAYSGLFDFSPTGENAEPICYTNTVPPTPTALEDRINDRRILNIAFIDCNAYPPTGADTLPVKIYMSVFLTEPASQPASGGSNDSDIYGEIVGYSESGGGGLVPVTVHEWVEVVR